MTALYVVLALAAVLALVAWTARKFTTYTRIVYCDHEGCTCAHCGQDNECPKGAWE